MNAPVLFGPKRERLSLGARLGKGGEGEVYALADRPAQAVKVYTSADAQTRQQKIAAMIEAGLAKQTSLVAFPIEVVTDQRGKFAGFTMAKVSEHKALHELYAPGARKAEFPKADYRFLVRTAANVARAVAAVHHAGCVIGDINHSGILVSDTATVALIDADSFQITAGSARYLCRVGVPEYTPPELQGRSLDSIARTQDHDAFGLAVVIFQLLWMGRHPFSGRYAGGEMPIEKAIGEHRFAYSQTRAVGMSPPPAAPVLGDFPSPIRSAFEAAFGGPGRRPSARDWVSLLGDLERGVRTCAKSSLHHYPGDAKECPWCRMEAALGVQLFLPPISLGVASAPIGAGSTKLDVSALWRAIEAVQAPPATPPTPTFRTPAIGPSMAATAAKNSVWARRAFGAVVAAGALALLFLAPSAWIFWLGGAAFGLWLAFTLPSAAADVTKTAKQADNQFVLALRGWWDRCAATSFEQAKAELLAARDELVRLPEEEKRRVAEYTRNRRTEQLRAYLQGFQIRRYKIRGVGPSKLATLTSYGIESAADVVSGRVLSVPGFGPVNTRALLEWRARIEARFAYDPNNNQLDRAKLAGIKTEIMMREAELRTQLLQGPKKLTVLGASIQARRAAVDPQLQKLYEKRLQAAADLKLFGQALPALPAPTVSPAARPAQPSAPPARPQTGAGTQSTYRPSPKPAQAGVSCPQCGSGMFLRTARRGQRSGRKFWGCSRYPSCRGTRSY